MTLVRLIHLENSNVWNLFLSRNFKKDYNMLFGTLFNNIEIKHKDTSGNGFSQLKVPIAYGPMQKFLARIEQSPNLRKEVAITLPRMAFEMVGISYDPTRKSSTMQTFKVVDQNNNKITKAFMPVPYNVNIRLSIMTKLNEDALQIVEQILPYFQPHFNLTVNLVEQIGETRDIPMVLNSIQMDDDYEGDFTTRRSLVYTLDFTAKTYLFGPVDTGNDSIIKKVQVDYYTNTERKNASRELRYVATPKEHLKITILTVQPNFLKILQQTSPSLVLNLELS